MALLRIGNLRLGRKEKVELPDYSQEEPYMPGGDYQDYREYAGYDDGAYDEDYEPDYDGDYGDVYDPEYDGEYDEGYDDGYDPGYDDGYGYADGDPYYDDPGYGDYDDGYGDAPNYDDPGYDAPYAYPDNRLGDALAFVDDHEWINWLLLALLPPLGIALLWFRRRYQPQTRVIVSAASALWCVLVIALLIWQPFRGVPDDAITPVTEDQQVEADDEDGEGAPVSVIVSDEEVDDANAVYLTAEGAYYHKLEDCKALAGAENTSRVSQNTAIDMGKMACPYCLASHYSDGSWDLAFLDLDTEDQSRMTVYCSAFNGSFHTDPKCADLGEAHEVSLKDALLMAKTACEVCCPQAGEMVYCTKDGVSCHIDPECSGMRNASNVTYAEARVLGKKRCPVCIGAGEEEEAPEETGNDNTYYVFATAKGQYYHIDEHCSGMQNAKRVPIKQMLDEKRPACPTCCAIADISVYAERGGTYYHSSPTCSQMTAPVEGTLAQALAAGYTRCPVCWTSAE